MAFADSIEEILLRRETHFQWLTVENKTLSSEVVRSVQVKLKCSSEGGKFVDLFWVTKAFLWFSHSIK